jgi:HK97 family phage major capsid protein
VWPQLATMGLTLGTAGAPVFMPPGGMSGLPYSSIFGAPVLKCEQCKTLGTLGDIILADFSQYVIAEKGGIEAASSIHVRFLTDETTYRFVLRMDGQPWWQGVLTNYEGSGTTSPFIALETRA